LICWGAAVNLPIALLFINGPSIFGILALLGFFGIIILCLSSASAVPYETRYAKFGMRSVGSVLVALVIEAIFV
jgi:hypothetical protein